MELALRFDMRAPGLGAPASALYPACVEMCAWGDRLGFSTVYLAEHHGAADGYLPAPLVLGAAIAGATRHMVVHFSALLPVLHNPIRLAEDIAVLDVLSGGRTMLTLGLGYRPHEYELFGVQKSKRVAVFDEALRIMKAAWTGEPFEYHGMTVVVRPTPVQQPHPPIFIGGSAEASALRAARLGAGYLPAIPGLMDVYEAELARLGKSIPVRPVAKGPLFLYVTEDPDKAWALVGPHVLYTSNMNAEWAKERGVGATPYPPAQSWEELRGHPRFAVVTPDECVALAERLGPHAELSFQPLMGALPPEHGWSSLELFESAVLPRLRSSGLVPA
jgi:alkanesulfonate monooxygenase SsuD/methylene tetrahydromethanopterin reductase-like flavin-dependent oxidoreductase (luciferase family)